MGSLCAEKWSIFDLKMDVSIIGFCVENRQYFTSDGQNECKIPTAMASLVISIAWTWGQIPLSTA